MDFDMSAVKIEPTRYSVILDNRQIGYCIVLNGLWTFFCNLDNTTTKAPSPELAIARKLARLRLCHFPDGSGKK